MGKNHRLNRLYKAAEVGQVRLSLVEALARQIKSGAFFCDSMFKKDTKDFNELVKTAMSPERVNLAALVTYEEGEYVIYDQLRFIELFIALRDEGYNFVFKATERGNPHKISFDAYKGVAEKGGYDIHKRMSRSEKVALAKKIVEDINIRAVQIRDKFIVRNIVKNGLDENILYVGKHHKLGDLASSGLEWYRVNADFYRGRYRVYGRLPSRFMNNMNNALSGLGLTLDQKLQYV
ncbi:MAG: hypothetical protein ABIH63_02415 [archaeon]